MLKIGKNKKTRKFENLYLQAWDFTNLDLRQNIFQLSLQLVSVGRGILTETNSKLKHFDELFSSAI